MPEIISPQEQMALRNVTKRCEEGGLSIRVSAQNKLEITPPETFPAIGRPDLSLVEARLNASWTGLGKVAPESAALVLGVLNRFRGNEKFTDLIMYGPAKKGSVDDRMARLAELRGAVTQLQESKTNDDTFSFKDRPGLVAAATFVRSSLPDYGLETIARVLEAKTTPPR